MGKVNFTNPQKDAIEISGGDVIVCAAAGSGKTAVLTQKVVDMLTCDNNPVMADKIIIVTFTVASADEMRRRIHEKIAVLIKNDKNNKLLQKQNLLLASAKICTIHSLCSFIIRDYFQELSLPSNITIADETQMSVLKKEALTEVIDHFYENGDLNFLELTQLFTAKDDREIISMVFDMYDYIRSLSFPIKYLDDSLAIYEDNQSIGTSSWFLYVLPHIIKGIEYSIYIINKALKDMDSDEIVKAAYANAFIDDKSLYEEMLDCLNGKDIFSASECFNTFESKKLSSVRGYEDKDFLDKLKAQRKLASDIVKGLAEKFLQYTSEDFQKDNDIIHRQLKTLFSVVKNFYFLLEDKKKNINKMDYSDLEHYTLKLLLDNENKKSHIANELSSYYEQIMIDECQDINEIQNLIFTLLSKEKTNLFMVGDVKQSIYRFRNAMPSLFIDKIDKFPKYQKQEHNKNATAKISLDYNFRSSNDICHLINFIFSTIMTHDMGEVEYNQGQELIPGACYKNEDLKIPELHIVDYSGDGDINETNTEIEAQYIADIINKMIRDGFCVTQNNESRPCCAKDFVILLRSKKGKASFYAQALNRFNINSISESTEGYFNQYEIQVVLNLLRIIHNPMLEIPVLSVLMSPVGGFSPDDIVKIRLYEKNRPLFSGLLSMEQLGDKRASKFLDMIRALREKAITMNCDEILREIYDETEFFSLVYAMGDGEQRGANLRLLLLYAQKYNEIGNGGIGGFLRYIDKMIELKDGKFSLASVAPDSVNAVRIMTIHSSKGLEFPICIVADCAKKFNERYINTALIQKDNKLGVAIKIIERKKLKKYTSISFEAIRLKNKKELMSEEMRMLYVALTRAKEKLIMVGTLKSAQKKIMTLAQNIMPYSMDKYYETFRATSYLDWLIISLLGHECLTEFRIKYGFNLEFESKKSDGRVAVILSDYVEKTYNDEIKTESQYVAQSNDDLKKKLQERFSFLYDKHELTKLPAKVTVTKLAKKEQTVEYSLEPLEEKLLDTKITNAQKGTISHRFMQFANFYNAKDSIDNEITRLINHGFMTSKECANLEKESIEKFLSSNLFKKMQNAKDLKREYKFLYFISASEIDKNLSQKFQNEKVLLQGIADCLIFEDDGITIVDYKTDRTSSAKTLCERYEYQIKLYSDAISKAFEQNVKQGIIYSLYLNKSIEIDISND